MLSFVVHWREVAGREVFDDGVPVLWAPRCAWTVVATAGRTRQGTCGLVGSCGHGVDAWQKLFVWGDG